MKFFFYLSYYLSSKTKEKLKLDIFKILIMFLK